MAEKGVVISESAWRRVALAVRAVEAMQRSPRGRPRRSHGGDGGSLLIPAIIASATAIDSGPDHYWEYTAQSAQLDNTTKRMTVTADPTTYDPCYNPAETPNDGSGVEGVGIEIGSIGGATVTMDPLNTGLGVYLLPQTDDAGETWYAILCGPPNPLVVECP